MKYALYNNEGFVAGQERCKGEDKNSLFSPIRIICSKNEVFVKKNARNLTILFNSAGLQDGGIRDSLIPPG